MSLLRLLPLVGLACLASLFVLNESAVVLAQNNDDGPSRFDLSRTEDRIENWEEHDARMNGAPYELRTNDREAMELIVDLRREYPDNPQVQELFERVRVLILSSRGVVREITEEDLAFREQAEIIRQRFYDLSVERWEEINEELEADESTISDAFPAPDPTQSDLDEYLGRTIKLEGVQYPMGMFSNLGTSYIAVGRASTGFYYVNVSSRGWRTAYEAVRRYRREVGGEIPQEVEWTVVGRITDVELAVPVAGEEPVGEASFGWVIDPDYIWIPGFVLTETGVDNEFGGQFIGEDRVDEIKGPLYSLTEVPEDASPEDVVHAWHTAIQERNYDFYVELIDPNRRETGPQMEIVRYHWDWHMFRWWDMYVAYDIIEGPEIEIVRGEEIDELEMEFLTEEERRRLMESSEPYERLATFKIRYIGENGRQIRRPQNFYLRKYEDGRWWVGGPHLPN